MQECFRKYPEIYGSELEEADAAGAEGEEVASAAPAAAVAASEIPVEDQQQLRDDSPAKSRHSDGAETDNLPGVKLIESSVPKVAHDATEKNEQN